jgi:hypothetical protein
VASSSADEGSSHEQPGGRNERQLIHPDGDHPRRELIEPEAPCEGETRKRSDKGTEKK